MTFNRALRIAGLTWAAVAAAGGVSTAAAQTSQTVEVIGSAEQRCVLGQPQQGTGALFNFDAPSGSVFRITRLADPESLSTRAAQVTLALTAMCNSSHRVVIGSDNNGLWRDSGGAAPSGFADAVPYTATLTWADQERPLTAEGIFRQGVEEEMRVDRPNTGAMAIQFRIDAGATNAGQDAPLLAGEYSDVLRVTVESQ